MSNKIRYSTMVLVFFYVFYVGCTSIKTGNLTDSLLLNGDNNFVMYSPNKSNTYRTSEVYNKIDYHYETIKLIDKTITNYEIYEQRLEDSFRDKKISKKDYFKNIEKVKRLKNEVKLKRSEAQKALNEWKSLLHTSSNIDEQRNKFISDSIAFEKQTILVTEQNRKEKERLEAENSRIEREKQRLAERELELNNRMPSKPINRQVEYSVTDLYGVWVYLEKSLDDKGNEDSHSVTVTFAENGESSYLIVSPYGVTGVSADWQYMDGVLTEIFSEKDRQKSKIQWLSHDKFELNIISNWNPNDAGKKIIYNRK